MEQPPELQILMQLLGPDQGRMVFALNTLAGSCAQMSQQIAEQAERIGHLTPPAAPAEAPPAAAPVNQFTGETVGTQEAT